MKKVLFLTNIPSPYRVAFFNELGKLCDLTVVFEQSSYRHRDESWKNYEFKTFKGIILEDFDGSDGKLSFKVIKHLKEKYDFMVMTNISTPTGLLALLYLKLTRRHYGFEIDGGVAKNGKGIKEKLKQYLISGADFYFSPSFLADDYYMAYGADKEKIIRYPFTSLYNSDVREDVSNEDERKQYKLEKNIKEEKVVITIGQFINRKGFDLLLNACKNISKEVGIYIIGGDKPTDEYKELCDKYNLTNVHFIPFMCKEELFKYYRLSNVFVFPTREDIWGLVTNEAMANGTAVVSSDKAISSKTLIENGVNGYIYECEDIDKMAQYINKILENEDLEKQLGRAALKTIKEYTYENMAKMHAEYFNKNEI